MNKHLGDNMRKLGAHLGLCREHARTEAFFGLRPAKSKTMHMLHLSQPCTGLVGSKLLFTVWKT